jgi:hypothetical protein
MERAWRDLGHLVSLQATGGSTTTVIVNSSENNYTSDDQLVGGTVMVTRDAGGAGAAPEGEYSIISDYVASTKTWTVGTLSAGVASGDHVGLVKPKIRLTQMIQAVNDGLASLGTISLVDTSITTASDQTEYALPVGLKIKELKDVLLQMNTDDANDNEYKSIIGMIREFPAAPASTGLLQFSSQPPDSRTLKIVYEGVHPELADFDDVVSETIQEELATAATIDKALEWYVSKRGQSALGTFEIQRRNFAQNYLERQKFEKPIYRAPKRAKFFIHNA